jgi:hypothetical protein
LCSKVAAATRRPELHALCSAYGVACESTSATARTKTIQRFVEKLTAL